MALPGQNVGPTKVSPAKLNPLAQEFTPALRRQGYPTHYVSYDPTTFEELRRLKPENLYKHVIAPECIINDSYCFANDEEDYTPTNKQAGPVQKPVVVCRSLDLSSVSNPDSPGRVSNPSSCTTRSPPSGPESTMTTGFAGAPMDMREKCIQRTNGLENEDVTRDDDKTQGRTEYGPEIARSQFRSSGDLTSASLVDQISQVPRPTLYSLTQKYSLTQEPSLYLGPSCLRQDKVQYIPQSVPSISRDDLLQYRSHTAEGVTLLTTDSATRLKNLNHTSVVSWREAAASTKKPESKKKRTEKPVRLVASDQSWIVQQKCSGRDGDIAVERRITSVLNKLTIEKFESLYEQLLNCGICTTHHVEILMKEVFEKATTQHHFIEMYTVLCVNLNEWFQKGNIGGKERSFKWILLNQCQSSFEENLILPEEFVNASVEDEIYELKVKHKTKMLGNIKFVGRLLVNQMVASRILISCAHVLLETDTSEALESLAVFLTTVGPSFDHPGWAHHKDFCDIFIEIETLRKSNRVTSRIRYLLQDLLDLRLRGWTSRGTEGAAPQMVQVIPGKLGKYDASAKECNSVGRAKARSTSTQADSIRSSLDSMAHVTPFSLERFHEDCTSVLGGFARDDQSIDEGVEKLNHLPEEHRQTEWIHLVSRILDESKMNSRLRGFTLVLHLAEEWEGEGFHFLQAVDEFARNFDDLRVDIPELQHIITTEFYIVFKHKLPDNYMKKFSC